jgi:hypothetical protein
MPELLNRLGEALWMSTKNSSRKVNGLRPKRGAFLVLPPHTEICTRVLYYKNKDKPKGREQQKKQHAAQEAFFDIETDGPKRVV